MPIDRHMDKENVVSIYSGIIFSFTKEGNSTTINNMDRPWGMYAKWNKPVTSTIWYHLHEVSKIDS